MADQNAFAELMARLRAGDDDVATLLFDRYHQRLLALARKRLSDAVRQKVDPDDVVQSVYRSFFHRHQLGQFQVEDWDNLWTLLTLITVRKCAGRAEYFLTACRNVRKERAPAADDSHGERVDWQPEASDPTAEEAVLLAETIEQVMRGLDGWECEVFTLSLQGYSVQEIGERVGRAERSVERVRGRVKKRLLRLQEDESDGP